MEVINDLLNYKQMKIVQNTDWFSFSLDSILLANFVTINKNIKKIIDLGTGNAPIPMIISLKTEAKIYAVEIQEEIYKLAIKSLKLNKLTDRIKLINDNFKNMDKVFETDTFDVITCNPPYFKYTEDSNINRNPVKMIARHEKEGTLEDVIKVSKKILRNNGLLAIVHRTDRLIDIIILMKKYNIEPKRLRFVYPKMVSESNIVLIEGKKSGNPGLKILPPLYVHEENGDYTEEVKRMFE